MPFVDEKAVLILHCDGVNDGTSFIDSSVSAKTVTRYNTLTKTSEKKFGTASGYFSGSSNYLTLADSSDWEFGSGDFTVECWFRVNTVTASNVWYGLMSHRTGYNNNHAWSLGLDQANSGILFAWTTDGSTFNQVNFGGALTANTWYHVAVCRSGDNLYCFLNGNLTLNSLSGTLYNSTAVLMIGTFNESSQWFPGYMDEIMIQKGVAAWTASFTPPTEPYYVGIPAAYISGNRNRLHKKGVSLYNQLA